MINSKWIASLMLAGGLALVAGCGTKTETGYKGRGFGDSAAVQRGYYAPAYSPEARKAEQARMLEFDSRRPDTSR